MTQPAVAPPTSVPPRETVVQRAVISQQNQALVAIGHAAQTAQRNNTAMNPQWVLRIVTETTRSTVGALNALIAPPPEQDEEEADAPE